MTTPDDDFANVEIAAWADQGSPAALSARVHTTPPLENDDSPLSFDRLRSRINECLRDHEECSVTLFGEVIDEYWEPELPRRILAIKTGCIPGQIQVRLLETHGMRGNYAALGHCWGPEEKNPLLTTTANFKDHLNGIAFESLPKTYRDAVVVAEAIGVQYLWIDSLCIKQGDEQDWLEASAVMGSIYEKARLMIAASAAKDPTEGLFRSIRPERQTLALPYYDIRYAQHGSFNVSAGMAHVPSPYYEALSDRGWALQEWYLSRRIVHFTHGGVSWKCKKFEICERHLTRDFQQCPGWTNLIEKYSGCDLTVKTDCLIALQGLVNEMKKTGIGRYHAGIWEASLPHQLLWMVDSFTPDNHSLSTVPSWSWASQTGPKVFWSEQGYELDHTDVALCEMMKGNPDIITSRAPLKRCVISKQEIDEDVVSCVSELGETPENDMLEPRREPIHSVEEVGDRVRQIVGLAALDNEPCSDVYCLFLASSIRSHTDDVDVDCRNDPALERAIRKKMENREESDLDHSEDVEVITRMTAAYYGEGKRAYWALLLKKLPQYPSRFKRVGMAIIWSDIWAPREASTTSLELV